MPEKARGDLIREHGELITSLIARLEHHRRDLDRIENELQERAVAENVATKRIVHDLDKQLAVVARDVERLEQKLDELLSRRWELWKLVLAAFLGSLLTVAAGFLSRSLDRRLGVVPGQNGSAMPTPGRR